MSTTHRQGNKLTQGYRGKEAELGYINHEESTGKFVLMLKDTRNLFNTNYGYVRGDEYPSLEAAKSEAQGSASARLMHELWIAGLQT